MDTCDLLLNTLEVLPNEFTASSAGVPSTQERTGDTPTITNNKRACEEQQADDNNFKHHVSESFGHLALAEGHLALGSALEKKWKCKAFRFSSVVSMFPAFGLMTFLSCNCFISLITASAPALPNTFSPLLIEYCVITMFSSCVWT
jgi:hypothetical protein